MEKIIIGKQIWASKNLNVNKFRNGDPIPEVLSAEDWERVASEKQPAFCYYNNDPQNAEKNGILYNLYALTDPRGLAPEGWRLPSKADWEELIRCLGGGKTAGKKMKSTNDWLEVLPGENGNGTDESGFNAYPGGNRNFMGKFANKGLSCSWWCLDEDAAKTENGWFFYLVAERATADFGIFDPEDGLYVRCVNG